MNMTRVLKSLGPIDVRSIRRDSLISWMIFLPLLMALIIRFGVPPLTASLQQSAGFDLTPYFPVILAYFCVMITPLTLSVVIGFLLLDEKDDQTLTALQVTPLPLTSYLAYRVSIPLILTVVMMFVVFPLAGIDPLPPGKVLVAALAVAPFAPMFALYIGAMAQNKVQGFALMKLSGAVLVLPILAFFVEAPWEYLFGIVPTYWPMKVYWMLDAGQAGVWLFVLIAIVYQSLVLAFFVWRFNRQLHS